MTTPRKSELLEAAYSYALQHGLSEMSLRPIASAIGSSPRVLLYLFGSKDGLIRALLARARVDELAMLDQLRRPRGHKAPDLATAAERVWSWLTADEHRPLLTLWVEGYARSLVEPDGPWGGFAQATVDDWLSVLAEMQSPATRDSPASEAERVGVLAVLRGALLDLLATGDVDRTTAAVQHHLRTLHGPDGHKPEIIA